MTMEHDESSGSDSSVSDILDLRNEEGWEDVEPDTEEISISSLYDDQIFNSAKEMLTYCKDNHGFDIWRTKQELNLEFFELIKLVNYIRSEVRKGNKPVRVDSKSIFEDDSYLKPVLEDDALLYSLDDVFDSSEDISGPQKDEIEVLREQFAELQNQFLAYREQVQKSLLSQGEDSTVVTTTDQANKQAKAKYSPFQGTDTEQDKGYFESYSYNLIHEIMLKDTIRTDAYRDFIYDNKLLFKDKVVLDVGCGTGILSMFCAKAGAKMVIAVDNSAIIDKTRENVFRNGFQDQIRCLHGKIEEVVLPVPQVDIIISEWMGYCLLYESMLDSVLYARDKYLATDGLMVPSHATLRLAPLADSELKASHIDFWHDVYGFDMRPMLERAHEEALIKVANKDELATDGTTFAIFDLHRSTVTDLSFSKPFSTSWKEGFRLLEGFVIWFDIFFAKSNSQLNPDELEIGKTGNHKLQSFSTGPSHPATHWQQGVLLIENPQLEVQVGNIVNGQITYRKKVGQERSLDIEVEWEGGGIGKQSQIWVLD